MNQIAQNLPCDSQIGADIRLSAGDAILNALSCDPARPVVIFEDTGDVVTADAFLAIITAYASVLNKVGLSKGARVGLLSRNRPEVLYVNAALPFLELCIVPMHPMGSLDDLAYIFEDSSLEALIFDPRYYEGQAKELKARFPAVQYFLALGPSEVGVDMAEAARTARAGKLKSIYRPPEDIVRLTYSGGTTGKSKAIMSSGRCSAASMDIMLKEWEWPDEIRQLVCAPLSHGGGAVVIPTILKGGTLVVLSGFNPEAVMQAIEKHRITCVLLVPAMIYALLDHPKFESFDLSSLEVIYYGASAISPSRLREGIERIGPVFFQFYGQAEAPMSVCVMRRADHVVSDTSRLASCGRPTPWVTFALIGDDGQPVPDGTPGEICVRGPLLMSGYLNQPEVTAQAFEGGWLHTGDVAVRDQGGFIRIVDRKKDMIVTGGFNVYPREVEDVLTSHPSVAAAAVIGIPHDKWGESVQAMITLKPGASVDIDELIALVREKKGAVQAPKAIFILDQIPLTGVGKPDKKALRANFAAIAATAGNA